MDLLIDLSWLERFSVLTTSELLIGLLSGTGLLFNKRPAGRWLGLLLYANSLMLALILSEAIQLLTFASTLAIVAFLLYLKAFFYQKKRNSFFHLIAPSVALSAFIFFDFYVYWIGVLIAAVYLFLIINFLYSESEVRGFSYFGNPGPRIAWLRNFVGIQGVFISTAFIPISPFIHQAIFLILIGYMFFQLFQESAFLSPIPIGNKYKKSTLNADIKSSIIGKLDEVMREQHFYRRDDASLSSLAQYLGVTNHHLSQVLNDSLKISFQDLIARFRVREACQLLRDDANNQVKIENIANEVGYNSKSAFNTAFKRRTGLTPSEYREAKGVLIYGEERLSERNERSIQKNGRGLNHVFNLKISGDMIQHFFKIFSRNIKRNGLFSFLNILGLTVGFTCSILIYMYLQDELSYDKSIPDSDRIYRIAWMSDNPQTRTPHPMAQAMVNDFPEVEQAVSLSPWYGPGLSKDLVRVENVKRNIIFEEPDFYFADSTFFDVFQMELVEGDKDAMKKPYSLVISEPLAKKYFGDSSAIGRELKLNDMPIAVSAVVKPMPENAHFHFNAFINYITLKQINPKDKWMTWADFGHFNYLKLKEGEDASVLEAKIPKWVSGYLDWSESDLERLYAEEFKFELQPIQDIHLTSHLRWELENNGNILYIYILSFTLVFLLLIATINYVNLTTAKSVERAKEIGVRKTLGAVAKNLSIQFYIESLIFSLIAMILSILLAGSLLGSFNQLSGKYFSLSDLVDSVFLVKAISFCIVVGLLAGLYPALVLSAFKPTEVLKGKLSTSSKGIRIRSVLVVIQFTISAILISGSLIIFRQVQFMKEADLGFDQDAVISLNAPVSIEFGGVDLKSLRTVQDLLSSVSGIHSTALVSSTPGSQFNQHPYYLKDDPENRIDVSSIMVDYDIEKVLGFETVEGRTFNRSFANDSLHNVVINESMARMLNEDELIGKTIVQDASGNLFEAKIIGVVKDFHFQSLHEEIQPLLMSVQPLGAGNILVKLEGQRFAETLKQIETIYNANIKTDLPFEYEFLDQQLAQLYKQEEQTLSIFSVFALIALVLASLGLLGMAIAMLNQRIKEVGMRKILGATSSQIMGMILGQFAKLVVIALIIGLPLSYLLMQGWMQEFSYQVPFGVAPFLLAILILLVVSLMSVFSAVMKITHANPVESLRYE